MTVHTASNSQDRRHRARLTAEMAAAPGRHGVLTRKTLLQLGWTTSAIAHQVTIGRWAIPFPGVVFTTPPTSRARIRAAWLASGRDALVGGKAAAWLLGLAEDPPTVVDIEVPHRRTPAPRDGIRFHRNRHLVPGRMLDGVRIVTVERAVIDMAGAAPNDLSALNAIATACARRLTTPDRLIAALADRRRAPRRHLMTSLCGEVADGVMSALERWYDRDVARAHGLPRGRRQVRHRLAGRTVYSDVTIDEYATIVELDGRLGHEDPASQQRDRWRDNQHALAGRLTLRFGWPDATSTACRAASEVATVLHSRGWRGHLRPCGPRCTAVTLAA